MKVRKWWNAIGDALLVACTVVAGLEAFLPDMLSTLPATWYRYAFGTVLASRMFIAARLLYTAAKGGRRAGDPGHAK